MHSLHFPSVCTTFSRKLLFRKRWNFTETFVMLRRRDQTNKYVASGMCFCEEISKIMHNLCIFIFSACLMLRRSDHNKQGGVSSMHSFGKIIIMRHNLCILYIFPLSVTLALKNHWWFGLVWFAGALRWNFTWTFVMLRCGDLTTQDGVRYIHSFQ